MINSTLEYKGYHTKISFSSETFSLRGKIEGINDFVDFESDKLEDIEAEFHAAVDDYLAFCDEVGKNPDKEYKGTFNVRITPELHRGATLESEKRNMSLNQFVQKAIENEITGRPQEIITLVIPEQAIGRYAPVHRGAEIASTNFGKKEAINSWETVKFAGFES